MLSRQLFPTLTFVALAKRLAQVPGATVISIAAAAQVAIAVSKFMSVVVVCGINDEHRSQERGK